MLIILTKNSDGRSALLSRISHGNDMPVLPFVEIQRGTKIENDLTSEFSASLQRKEGRLIKNRLCSCQNLAQGEAQ